ncbi:MAG: FHA domain-containing protein [Gammaproteobacteria bacterium]
MSIRIPGLQREPFGSDGTPAVFIETPSVHEALATLDKVYRDPQGLGTLIGPAGSGRRTILEQFSSRLESEDICAVVVDGNGMDRVALLRTVLSRIGYELADVGPDDLSRMLQVFLLHQCHNGQPALLAFLNAGDMHPTVLQEICNLAAITAGDEYAARIVLAGDERLERIVGAPAMGPVRERLSMRCRVRPLDLMETDDYIVRHLGAAGAISHTHLLTDEAIALIWRASDGRPGRIGELTRRVLRTADLPADAQAVRSLLGSDPAEHPVAAANNPPGEPRPVNAPPPAGTRIVVTLDGRVVHDLDLVPGRYLLGRDLHNDVTLPSRYVSRHHALLILREDRAWIADLKSANGTFVNSRRVGQSVLRHEDVVSIGNHRLKYLNPVARRAHEPAGSDPGDTAIMRSLREAHRLFPVRGGGEDTVVQTEPTGTDDSNPA